MHPAIFLAALESCNRAGIILPLEKLSRETRLAAYAAQIAIARIPVQEVPQSKPSLIGFEYQGRK